MKKKKIEKAFLPVSKDEMVERGWYYYDFLVVTADAYIDHPSFGTAIIARVLEHEGYRVAVLAQPDWHSADAFRAMGRPRLGRGTGQPCPRPAGRFSAAGALCAPCRAHAHDPHPARGPRPERR